MKKQTLVLIGVVLIVVLVVATSQIKLSPNTNLNLPAFGSRTLDKEGEIISSPTPEVKQVSVVIDFGQDNKITGQTLAQSAYESLVKVAKENSLKVEGKGYKFGVVVTQIGQIPNKDGWQWVYLVNGRESSIASDRYIVNPSDSVEWLYKEIKN